MIREQRFEKLNCCCDDDGGVPVLAGEFMPAREFLVVPLCCLAWIKIRMMPNNFLGSYGLSVNISVLFDDAGIRDYSDDSSKSATLGMSAMQRIAWEFSSYGRPRITAELKRRGWEVNHRRVHRILREDNLLGLRRRKFVLTTDSGHDLRVYPTGRGRWC